MAAAGAAASALSPKEPVATVDNYKSLAQVQQALRRKGLESSNLIIGIDFTKSNAWTGKETFEGRSLHHIDPNGLVMNPYQVGGGSAAPPALVLRPPPQPPRDPWPRPPSPSSRKRCPNLTTTASSPHSASATRTPPTAPCSRSIAACPATAWKRSSTATRRRPATSSCPGPPPSLRSSGAPWRLSRRPGRCAHAQRPPAPPVVSGRGGCQRTRADACPAACARIAVPHPRHLGGRAGDQRAGDHRGHCRSLRPPAEVRAAAPMPTGARA